MKKLLSFVLCFSLIVSAAAFSASAASEVKTGKAQGFGGEVVAQVTVEDGKILSVEVTGEKETNGIGSNAIAELPAKIVEKGDAEVDVYTGATVSSKAIINAVKNAMDPEQFPYEEPAAKEPDEVTAVNQSGLSWGLGMSSSGRIGPGKDDTDTQVYSINQVIASVIFDAEGRVVKAHVDQIEAATPNYDGEGMPHFSGFPGQTEYNYDKNHDEKVDGTILPTEETFLSEISGWQTKRDRGESYRLSTATWTEEMNRFEELFVGKTVEEIKVWFATYCSDRNGRPLKAGSENEQDAAKYAALTEKDKAMLTDVTSGATMSLNDAHGNILLALEKAYNSRRALEPLHAVKMGLGVVSSGRVGPGKDDTDTQVYSINEVYAAVLFDEQDRVAAIYVDQTEAATPNYDGATMPHFSGYPGHGGYNYDENHDEKVETVLEPTDDSFQAELASWITKRERGDDYRLGTDTWTNEMNVFENLFVGKTVEEIQQWFATYCSDRNGRPLKAGSENEQDAVKYDALTEEDKAMLVDVTSGATMSLNDAHGNLIGAVANSLEKAFAIDLTVE